MDIALLASSLVTKLPCFQKWEPASLLAWLGWHIRGDEVIVVSYEGMILGAAIGRTVSTPEDCKDRYKHSDHGLHLCVDAIFAHNKETFVSLCEALRSRFYNAHYITFARAKYNNRYRTYKIDTFMKKLPKLEGGYSIA